MRSKPMVTLTLHDAEVEEIRLALLARRRVLLRRAEGAKSDHGRLVAEQAASRVDFVLEEISSRR